jgi:nitrite reductase/ring-hydroxylating ferredoxin subunit
MSTVKETYALNNDIVTEELFDWQNCWYPITFVRDLFNHKPYKFSLYDEALVLFRDAKGKLVCLQDLCPHRAAKLSDGQIIDGRIECLYHGWQFGAEGKCLHIPQLTEKATIPKQACVKSYNVVESQGIVWVWLGSKPDEGESLIPNITEAEKPGLFVVDTVTDLPYDQNFLVENFLDPAHVPISHDGTELGMKRELAFPLEMEVLSSSVNGFISRYRRPGSFWIAAEFVAPGLVKYQINNESAGIVGGFILFAIPNGQGQCRVLVRRYGNFFTRYFKLKPRWFEHLRQNKLLEEDLPFIVEQQAYIEQTGKSLKEIYLPLKNSDVFVIEHRKWLDKFGKNLPFYQGYATAKQTISKRLEPMPFDRFSRHTKICSSCYNAYHRINLLKQVLIAAAIILAGLGIVIENNTIKIIVVAISILASAMAAGAQELKTRFEQNYHKHDA